MTPAAENGVRRLYCGLSPDIKRRGVFLSLEAFTMFADDSYTPEVYAVGGFVGPMELWEEQFDPAWFSVLKEPPRLGYYTTNDALGLKGPFRGWTEESRNSKMAQLASVIPGGCRGVACHLLQADFEELFKPPQVWNDPYYLCAIYLIERVCQDLLLREQPAKVDFIFDRQGKVGRHFSTLYDAFLKPVSLFHFPFMGKCQHEDKQEFLALQAADMNIAWARRRASTIQLWTTADLYLQRFEQLDFRVTRSWLEGLAAYQAEHAAEIKAFWDTMNGVTK